MTPSQFYAHPRPRVTHDRSKAQPIGQDPSKSFVGARLAATRQAIHAEHPVVRTTAPHDTVDKRERFAVHSRGGTSTYPSTAMKLVSDMAWKDALATENVSITLRHKQRDQAREAWRTAVGTRGSLRNRSTSPAESCTSSPLSSPPISPASLPGNISEWPKVVESSGRAVQPRPSSSSPSMSLIHILRYRISLMIIAIVLVRAIPQDHVRDSVTRWLGASTRADLSPPQTALLKSRHRPARSHSSSVRQSLSRSSSQHSLSASHAAAAGSQEHTLGVDSILNFMKCLAPLPRFNPYRRTRAESMSAVVDDRKRGKDDVSTIRVRRRRCKSESAVRW